MTSPSLFSFYLCNSSHANGTLIQIKAPKRGFHGLLGGSRPVLTSIKAFTRPARDACCMISVALGSRPSPWQTLTAAPHRTMFFVGSIQLVATMSLWLAELAGRAGLFAFAPLPFAIASTWAHVLLMVYGLFVFFIYGFLLTVFPRWLGGGEVPRRRYVAIATVGALGLILIYAGLLTSRPLLLAGLLLQLGAWLAVAITLLGIYRASAKRRVHELLLMAELSLGALGLGCFAYGVLTGEPYAFIYARDIGLWGFLIPTLLTVVHRMIPFFTHSALPFTNIPRPSRSLGILVGGSLLHGAFELLELALARLAIDLVLAGVALHHTIIWGLVRSFANRLLAMLHIAFLWFGIAMSLYAVQNLLALNGIEVLGRAPLHALGIGFVTGLLVAMATRVTLGHSGRALAVKAPTWLLFLGINLVALLRVAAEVAPAALYQPLNLLSAAGWLICLIPWFVRYAPMYVRPRADHRPG